MRLILGSILFILLSMIILVIVFLFLYPLQLIITLFIVIILSIIAEFLINWTQNYINHKHDQKIARGKTTGIAMFLRFINKNHTINKVYVSPKLFKQLKLSLEISADKQITIPNWSIHVDKDMKNEQFATKPVEPYILSINDFY